VTALPAALGGGNGLVVWRLDKRIRAATWDSGEGAFRAGGRWNSKGVRAVYCSTDPATAILEVAVHIGFKVLDTEPYVITAARIIALEEIHAVERNAVPNPNWLRPGFRARASKPLATSFFVIIASWRFRAQCRLIAGT
jgi:RES domain-containing protein